MAKDYVPTGNPPGNPDGFKNQDKNYPAGPRAQHLRISEGRPTVRQERFCEEYVKHLNIKQAYVDAGYDAKNAAANAYKVFNKPLVQKRISELMAERREENKATVTWVMESLQKITQEAWDTAEYHAAIRSLQLIGMQLGMFDKKAAETGQPVPKTSEALDEELGRLLKLATNNGKKVS